MKKFTFFIIAILFFIIVHCTLKTENCMCQWYQITLPVSGIVDKMQFINQNSGWATVYQNSYVYALIRTTNKGLNWTIIYSDSAKVKKFQFINDTIGYSTGKSNGNYLISKTTNKGYNWTIIRSSVSDVDNGFYMINKDTGWVSIFRYPNSYILRTNNGFQTLDEISTGFGNGPSTLYFFKEKYNGEYCGYVLNPLNLYKTTNSGYNWQYISCNEDGNTKSFSFINKDTGWVVFNSSTGNNSKILFTTNSGINWTLQYSYPMFYGLGNLQALNKNIIYCGAILFYNIILKTTNSGLNWGSQTSQINSNDNLYLVDTALGFSWSNSEVARTYNGGGIINSIVNISDSKLNSYLLKQNYPNPFNPVTQINFELPKDGRVKLVIYDILGREINTLVNELKQAGRYTVEFNGTQYASGIYFYRIQVEDGKSFTSVKKMVLLK